MGRRLASFAGVGVVNTAVDAAAFALFLAVTPARDSLALGVVQVLSFTVGAATSFFLNSRWTWRDRRPRPLPFVVVTLAAAACSGAVAGLVSGGPGLQPPGFAALAATKVVATLVSAAVNFFGYHFWAFPVPVTARMWPARRDDHAWLLVIPVYNEMLRLEGTLAQLDRWVAGREEPVEVMFADDGSQDGTLDFLLRAREDRPWLSIVSLSRNLGRGGALKEAFRRARTPRVVYTDADLSSPLADAEAVAKALRAHDVVCGTRPLVARHSLLRAAMHEVFILLLRMLGLGAVPDPQCGLKAYRKPAVDLILPRSRQNGWVFDVESLVVARTLGLSIGTHEVKGWTDAPHSRVRPWRDAARMLAAVAVLLFRRMSGAYGPHPGKAVARGTVMLACGAVGLGLLALQRLAVPSSWPEPAVAAAILAGGLPAVAGFYAWGAAHTP